MRSVRFSPVIRTEQYTYIDESIPKPPNIHPISYTKKHPKRKKRRGPVNENELIRTLPRHLRESNKSTLLSEECKRVIVKQMLHELIQDDPPLHSSLHGNISPTRGTSGHPEKPFVKFHQNRANPFYWRDPVVVELNQKIEKETWNYAKVQAQHLQKKEMEQKRENARAIREKFLKHQKRNLLRRLKSGEPTVVSALEDFVESSVGSSSRDTLDDSARDGLNHGSIPSSSSSIIATPPASVPASKKGSFSSVSTTGFRKYNNFSSSDADQLSALNPRPPLPHHPVHVQRHGQISLMTADPMRRGIHSASSTRTARYGGTTSTVFQRVLQPSLANGAPTLPPVGSTGALQGVPPMRQMSAPSTAQGSSRIKNRLYAHINRSSVSKPSTSHSPSRRRAGFDPNRPVLSSDYTGLAWRRRSLTLEAEEAKKKAPRDELRELDAFEEKLASSNL